MGDDPGRADRRFVGERGSAFSGCDVRPIDRIFLDLNPLLIRAASSER
ncbi:hypothetical protein WMF30_11605 [Sorangium sp. So ce134]